MASMLQKGYLGAATLIAFALCLGFACGSDIRGRDTDSQASSGSDSAPLASAEVGFDRRRQE